MRRIQEYEIYLPSRRRDGRRIPSAELDKIKSELKEVFGGYTGLGKCEGTWKTDGKESRDNITILRILDDGSTSFDMTAFRKRIEKSLQQDRLLISAREIQIV
jgi:hypothetical protein